MDKLDIPSIPEFIEMIADTGAGLYACKASVTSSAWRRTTSSPRCKTSSSSASSTRRPPAGRSSSPERPSRSEFGSASGGVGAIRCASACETELEGARGIVRYAQDEIRTRRADLARLGAGRDERQARAGGGTPRHPRPPRRRPCRQGLSPPERVAGSHHQGAGRPTAAWQGGRDLGTTQRRASTSTAQRSGSPTLAMFWGDCRDPTRCVRRKSRGRRAGVGASRASPRARPRHQAAQPRPQHRKVTPLSSTIPKRARVTGLPRAAPRPLSLRVGVDAQPDQSAAVHLLSSRRRQPKRREPTFASGA